jgi:DNA-binding HxlR family transcriptional regulator
VKPTAKRSTCGINAALEVFGDKWTLLIVRDLLLRNRHQYSEFLLSEERIATNILANRLVQLESSGIISKFENPEGKSRTQYRLTQKGIDLLPILLELIVWSDKYYKLSDRGRLLADRTRNQRDDLIREILAQLPR